MCILENTLAPVSSLTPQAYDADSISRPDVQRL